MMIRQKRELPDLLQIDVHVVSGSCGVSVCVIPQAGSYITPDRQRDRHTDTA